MLFEKDEWDAWREHPVTTWFMDQFLAKEAEEAKQRFIEYAWGQRDVDPITHAAIFERAKVLNEMRSLIYEDMEDINY